MFVDDDPPVDGEEAEADGEEGQEDGPPGRMVKNGQMVKVGVVIGQMVKPLLLVVHQVNVLAAVDGEDGRHEQDDDHDEVEEQPRRQEPAELRQAFEIISRLFQP